ncbi:MAG: hypothetical protein ACMUJM_16280 [bacterium]
MKKTLFLVILFSMVALFSCTKKPETTMTADDTNDIFLSKESDPFPPDKMAFPASLSIHQNRPQKGYYFFSHNGNDLFNNSLSGDVGNNDSFDSLLSSHALISDKLVKIDYHYVNQIYFNEEIRGTVTRRLLNSLSLKYKTSLLCVFRRIIQVNSEHTIPLSYFLSPGLLISHQALKEIGDFNMVIINEALLFNAAHNKLYRVESTQDQIEFSSTMPKNLNLSKHVKRAAENGLKQLTININNVIAQIVEKFK